MANVLGLVAPNGKGHSQSLAHWCSDLFLKHDPSIVALLWAFDIIFFLAMNL